MLTVIPTKAIVSIHPIEFKFTLKKQSGKIVIFYFFRSDANRQKSLPFKSALADTIITFITISRILVIFFIKKMTQIGYLTIL